MDTVFSLDGCLAERYVLTSLIRQGESYSDWGGYDKEAEGRQVRIRAFHAFQLLNARLESVRGGLFSRSLKFSGCIEAIDAGFNQLGECWLVFEYFHGHDLWSEATQTSAHSIVEYLSMLSDIALILERAHRQGKIHGRLQLESIIVSDHIHSAARSIPHRRLFLADLGLPCDFAGLDPHYFNESIKRVAPHAAPEQFSSTGVIGPWTDVFAFSRICTQLVLSAAHVNGARLKEQGWDGTDPLDFKQWYVQGDIGRFFSGAGLSSLGKWYSTCTSTDPRIRFHSVREEFSAFLSIVREIWFDEISSDDTFQRLITGEWWVAGTNILGSYRLHDLAHGARAGLIGKNVGVVLPGDDMRSPDVLAITLAPVIRSLFAPTALV